MKVYLPFNSNDYNNIFSTLSISPRAFYPVRNYSFRRATPTVLNPFDKFILAYEAPVFHHRDFDIDGGYPILIETDISEENLIELELESTASFGFKVFAITNTVFLYNNFKLFFRNKKEQVEIEAKTLKSIETKFSKLAKENSEVAGKDHLYISNTNFLNLEYNEEITVFECFECERVYNKIAGAIVGYVTGKKKELNPEIRRLKNLSRELNNITSLLINNINQSDYRKFKERIIDCLNEIEYEVDKYENLETNILLSSNSNVNADFISKLKNSTILNINGFDLIIEGLLNSKVSLPVQLRIEDCRRKINSRFNTKYPENYIKKISSSIDKIKKVLKSIIEDNISLNYVDFQKIIKYYNSHFEIKSNLSEVDSRYFDVILRFLANYDDIKETDDLFRNRKKIIAELGQVLKEEFPEFIKGYPPRDYLINLYNSFESLTAKFNIMAVDSILFQSLGIMFTSGRDLNKYLNTIESIELDSNSIPLSLWGATYGFSSMPKTLTEIIFDDLEECQKLMSILKDANKNIFSLYKNKKSPFNYTELVETKKVDNTTNEETFKQEINQNKSPKGFIDEVINETKYGENEKLKLVLKNILSNQSNNNFLITKNDKIADFKVELHKKENKVKGIGQRKMEEIVSLYSEFWS